MSVEEKFNAAVNVIRNLPKNGAYQPSNELMLRFYSYYKQATEGPCQNPKPAFWEVVKKAKWDAWMRLGNMSRIEAMNNYVDELKKSNSLTINHCMPVQDFRKGLLHSKSNTTHNLSNLINFQIVETMSYTDNVANFLGSLDSFYESVPAEDLELLVGSVLERIRSQPGSPLSGSPLGSRETSPNRVRNTSRHITSSLETSPASSHSASPLPPDTDGEEEEFKDTVESAPERSQKDLMKPSTGVQQQIINKTYSKSNKPTVVAKENPSELVNGYSHANGHIESSDSKLDRGRPRARKDDKGDAEFFNQIACTMQNLQKDLDRITARVRNLEGQALSVLTPQPDQRRNRAYPKWWPLSECSPRMFAVLILWPFVAQALVSYAQRYRQRKL